MTREELDKLIARYPVERRQYEDLRNVVVLACRQWGRTHNRTPADAAVVLCGIIGELCEADGAKGSEALATIRHLLAQHSRRNQT